MSQLSWNKTEALENKENCVFVYAWQKETYTKEEGKNGREGLLRWGEQHWVSEHQMLEDTAFSGLWWILSLPDIIWKNSLVLSFLKKANQWVVKQINTKFLH